MRAADLRNAKLRIRCDLIPLVVVGLVMSMCFYCTPWAAAQDATSGAASESAGEDASGGSDADTQEPAVGDKELLEFRQTKVAAEMEELEERMYRLSEAIKELEPENSSRLLLGLKYAREELILHQMKLTRELLKNLELGGAVTEEKQLLAKLQRLHDLLLSTDLDFQLRLERLRQIREVLRRLDTAIKEEQREQDASQQAAEKKRQAEGLKKRQVTLDELIKRQTGHVEQTKELADSASDDSASDDSASDDSASDDSASDDSASDDSAADGDVANALTGTALKKLAKQQDATRAATEKLAGEQSAPKTEADLLDDAAGQMQSAVDSTEQERPGEAVPSAEAALTALKEAKKTNDKEIEQRERELSAARFAALQKDQTANRQFTEGITEMVRGLGESGADSIGEMIRADGSMMSAESELGRRNAEPAGQQQGRAVDSLKLARERLSEEAERLLDQLRAEVRKRVLEGLTLMLEKQIAVREATELLAPRVEEGSRQALTSVVRLAQSEARIIETAATLISLVEETEFGIALPATLRVVQDSMIDVEEYLADGDATDPVVTRERNIEADLAALLEAMKQMPSSRPPSGEARRGGPRERERELNRLIAELKMVRILQLRVNGQTVDVDGRRPSDAAALSARIRDHIEDLEANQDDVRDITDRLADERGDEIQ